MTKLVCSVVDYVYKYNCYTVYKLHFFASLAIPTHLGTHVLLMLQVFMLFKYLLRFSQCSDFAGV